MAYRYHILKNEWILIEKESEELLTKLTVANEENSYLFKQTQSQQAIIDAFTDQIQGISSTVGDLEKLSQTDGELLKKYSKVFFLNENYVPTKLIEIDKDYVYNGTTNFLIHTQVSPYLEHLLQFASSSEVNLLVASAFRSFDTQASLKSGYKILYGSGTANQFSADQGYSEHQLGTSVDFTTSRIGGSFSKFESDPAFKWLQDNAYKYGFVLSYPKENTYYTFEPWHWRFVGTALAKFLHEEDKYFYDLDQREIDTYLIKLFD